MPLYDTLNVLKKNIDNKTLKNIINDFYIKLDTALIIDIDTTIKENRNIAIKTIEDFVITKFNQNAKKGKFSFME